MNQLNAFAADLVLLAVQVQLMTLMVGPLLGLPTAPVEWKVVLPLLAWTAAQGERGLRPAVATKRNLSERIGTAAPSEHASDNDSNLK